MEQRLLLLRRNSDTGNYLDQAVTEASLYQLSSVPRSHITAHNEYMMIDATIVRAYQHSTGARKKGEQAIGRSRGGLTTKIHALVDALDNPVELMLTPGQATI